MQELKSQKEKFEDVSGSGSSLSFNRAFNPSAILNIELREILATPRRVPRQLREEIAEILIYELFSEKGYEIKDEKLFTGKFGAFYLILLSMRDFSVWAEIKALAETNIMAGVFILRTLLEELFTLLDDYEKIEQELSKKFPKSLEKSIKALKDLISETKAVWEKNRLLRTEKNSQGQEKQDTLQKQGIEKKIQKNFLNGSEGDVGINQARWPGTTAESEKLVSMTQEFMSSEKAGEILDSAIGEKIAAKIEELIPALEDHLEMLEILSMLFPGRMWDHSLQALHREYFGNLEKYAAMLRKNSDLHEILEQVGRIELEYGSKKLNLSPYSKSEVHSITFSGDIQTLLPVEAVKLRNPLLKLKFYADMLEGKLLTYQLRGDNWNSDTSGKKRKGPVVALVDTSASMRGSPEILAKSVLLAVTKRMLKEGRDVKIILFSSKWQTFEIELTDKKRMGREFLEFLQFTFGGGTDFNTALRAGLKAMKNEKAFEGADLLFLTDGASELSERPLIREWNEIKTERKARIFSLIIGNSDAGGLEQVSDHTYLIRNAENWEVGESPASFVKAISKPFRF
ncbi:VWA domain-containing protein [Methanosarcina sp. Z-7115]|uniref:VWA domain-containing protein n=1 Tax=Methanosarcina baikalica TaxID=3073890 RepID=A0ABU2CWZ7_9EURY|nr:VWA domain-containing protein [Methanosarcina sp. Z-7115]MDR7664261.1 VWA domain-containing protein [Methanosarcina sp. Z-7115]